ncbi:MAG: IclR family transcriptional regulator [Firmicutes bacterium]|nr:IclR family transcriptional regulator [Bacillota bacterium]MBR5488399.1 IclR family transcriptional regulator [Bacillota bacterium]
MMEKQNLSSLKKAILILETLAKEPYEYTAQALSAETGINITTIYRTIYQLEEEDMVVMDRDTKKYKIGPNAYHIGAAYVYNNNYMKEIEAILMEISEKTGESVGLAVRDRDKIISLIEIEAHHAMKMYDAPGRIYYPNKGNYGKCIMAFREPAYIEEYLNTHTFEKTFPAVLTKKEELLEEYAKIRERGYSESIDEQAIDVIGTGMPLFDHKGKIWGCVAIAFFRADGWEQHLAEVRNVAFSYKKKIEQYLP